MRAKITKTRILIGLAALLWTGAAGAPFYFMFISSLKKQFEVLTTGVFSLPKGLYLDNYKSIVESNFYRYLLNSIFVVSMSLILILLSAAFASYPLSRFRLKANKYIFAIIVAAMTVPVHVTLIPIFELTQKLHIYDSVWALIGPYVAFNIPISVFILKSFMDNIPRELEEAAEIDGCGKFGTFFRVLLPLLKPGLATLAIYNSVNMWNEFSFALVLTQSEHSRTLPLSIWEFQGQYASNIPMIMTVLTMCAVPMIIAFIVGQDKLIKGMMAGAVKG